MDRLPLTPIPRMGIWKVKNVTNGVPETAGELVGRSRKHLSEVNVRRKIMIITGAVFLTLAMFSMAFAIGGGNPRKGKFLWRKNCRSCHSPEGSAGDLNPADKTQAEWQKLFESGNIPCKKDWTIGDGDQNDIYTYLHDFAKDSPTPAKCS